MVTVVDLSNAFFNVPIHLDSLFWFSWDTMKSYASVCPLCSYHRAPLFSSSWTICWLQPQLRSSATPILSTCSNTWLLKVTKRFFKQCSAVRTLTFLGHVKSGQGHTLSPEQLSHFDFPKASHKMLMQIFFLWFFCFWEHPQSTDPQTWHDHVFPLGIPDPTKL